MQKQTFLPFSWSWRKSILSFNIKYDINHKFLLMPFIKLGSVLLFQVSWKFFQECMLDFVKCFCVCGGVCVCVSIEIIVSLLFFSLLVWWIFLIECKLNLHSWNKFHFDHDVLFFLCIVYFVLLNFVKNFCIYVHYMRVISLWFSFLIMSFLWTLSTLGIHGLPGLSLQFGDASGLCLGNLSCPMAQKVSPGSFFLFVSYVSQITYFCYLTSNMYRDIILYILYCFIIILGEKVNLDQKHKFNMPGFF